MVGVDLEASERRRRAIVAAARPAVEKTGKAISRKVADARAHAEASLTGSLIGEAAGKPTVLRARRSRSLVAALARLDELAEVLAGPSSRSLGGSIRDAWEGAFRDAWAHARATSHPDDLDPRHTAPDALDVARSRSIVIEGHDARSMVLGPIGQAQRSLGALVAALATPTRTPNQRAVAIQAWQTKVSRAIGTTAGLAIYSGAFRLDTVATRAVLRPELLHPDPTVEG